MPEFHDQRRYSFYTALIIEDGRTRASLVQRNLTRIFSAYTKARRLQAEVKSNDTLSGHSQGLHRPSDPPKGASVTIVLLLPLSQIRYFLSIVSTLVTEYTTSDYSRN